MGGSDRLLRALRLIVLTDPDTAAPRSVEEVVEAAIRGGARAVQVRDKGASAGELLARARSLGPAVRRSGGLLFVNDRLDVALAAGADGVHLGPDDLPLPEARRVAPPPFLIGYSTDDPAEARRAEAEGADYLGCGTVYPTPSKEDAGEVIGPQGLARVCRAVGIPVVGIGGVTPERATEVAAAGAAGCAVLGAVMGADDPEETVRRLLEPFGVGGREA